MVGSIYNVVLARVLDGHFFVYFLVVAVGRALVAAISGGVHLFLGAVKIRNCFGEKVPTV